jgi:histone demethylase JARID1
MVDKRPLDLYKLKKFVEDKGGFEAVCKGKKWADIGRSLGYSGKIMSSLSTSLKNSYQKWLQPYEDWLRDNKPAVLLAEQERENGTPYTPSPGPNSTHNTPRAFGNAEPAMKATQILNATLNEATAVVPAPPQSSPPPPPPPPPASSGFTAVNAGGFTAVNAPPPAAFAAVNAANGQTASGPSTPQRIAPAPAVPPAVLAATLPNGSFNLLKRRPSMDSESLANGDGDDDGRRSKRLKQSKFERYHRCNEKSSNPLPRRLDCTHGYRFSHGTTALTGVKISCAERSK